MIIELPKKLIDKESGEPVEVTAVIDTVSRETIHRPIESSLLEDEPDG